MTKTCIAMRHIHFEDLGNFSRPITDAGYDIQYLDPTQDDLDLAKDAELTVLLGGPIGVYEENAYPFLEKEVAIAVHRLKTKQLLLGICLGAQIIARACGAKVYTGDHGKEIGWKPIILNDDGNVSVIAPLGEEASQMFHWHGDTFHLPDGAKLLASTELYSNQIFSIDNHVLAFQCHPEFDPNNIEKWLVGHAFEISQTANIDAQKLRSDTQKHSKHLVKHSQKMIAQWLEQYQNIKK